MSPRGAVTTKAFSQAKAELSELMNQVVREHRPTVIERRREAMVALSLADLRALLEAFRFEPRIVTGRQGTIATLEDLGLVGSGRGLEAAIDDLLRELRDYAEDFLRRYSFYMQTDRRAHAPWIFRFALTPAEEQRDLLVEEPTDEVRAIR